MRLNCIQLVGKEGERSSDISLTNISTHDCGRHGIHIKGANHVTLKHIVSYRNGVNVDHDHNIYLLRVNNATIRDVVTYGAAGNGFSSTQLHDATLTNITAYRNGRRGIRFGAGRRIRLNTCTVIRNGLKLNHQADGIVIVNDDFGHTSARIKIQNCIIKHNRDYGIWISYGDHIQLLNNIVTHNPAGNVADTLNVWL